jgi:hypothetical protein
MAITYYAGNRWTGTSTDRGNITTGNITAGLTFLETNTDDLYQWDGDSWNVIAGDTVAQTLVNKTLTSPVLTTPQINDTSADHQYVFAVSELAADRIVTLPLLTAGDTLTFNNHAATLQNKTIVHGSNGNSVTGLVNASLSGSAAITNANLANSTITMAATAGSSDAIALGETFTFTAGEGIDTTMGSNAVTIAAEDATDSNKGIASFSTDNFTVSSGVVTIKDSGVNNDELAGSIANAKLANSAITIGGTATSLGGTITALTALTDLDLTAGNKTIFDTVGANTLTIGAGNTTVNIAGSLTISGASTLVTSNTVTIGDALLLLNSDESGTPSHDSGYIIERGSSANVGLIWDESADEWVVINTNSTGTETGNVTISSYANFQAADITATTQAANNNSTLAATTAYVQTELTAYADDTVTFTNKSLSGEQVNSGTVADARIAATLSRITGTETLTNKTLTNPVLNGTLSGSAFLDEDDFASNSAIAVASQQSIAAYIATQITAEDLDVTSDSGTIDIDLNSETLTIAGGTGLGSTASGTTVTLNIDSTVATLTGTQTLTNKTLTAPKIANAGFIADANGAEQIIFATTSSAVNELTITNGATGSPAQIAASGETNIGLKLAGKGTEGVILTNATANGAFLEFDTKAAPADPSAEQARLYLKQVDGNNNALAVKIQKAGAIVEVEITSPKAVCGVCGSKDGASDPTYDFSRDVMILDLWCGHSFEVPMQQWSHINGNS